MATAIMSSAPTFRMSDTSTQKQLGLVMAYLVPGFVGLTGLVPLAPAVGQWIAPLNQGDLGFGPPIYALLSALTVGMIVGCVRWAVVDSVLEWSGVPKAVQGYENLTNNLEAFDYLIEGHYRFYQCYSNLLASIVWAYLLNRFMNTLPLLGPGTDLGVFILCAVLLAGARDSLKKYRTKVGRILGPVAEKV